MPIYAYRCASCGFEEEALQKVSEAPLTQCSSCGKPTLEKQVTAAGFQLKGSGWYVTDFRDNGKKKPESTGVAPVKKSAESAPSGDGGSAGASGDSAAASAKSESASSKSESASSAPAAAPATAPSAKPSGQ